MIKILIGFISGIISGMGMGGGTILILLLNIIIGIDQHAAQATNLIFFIPTSIVSIIVNLKNKNIDLKLSKIIVVVGCIGAILGANIGTRINKDLLKKCFGIFLLIITINEIYSIIKLYKTSVKRDNKYR